MGDIEKREGARDWRGQSCALRYMLCISNIKYAKTKRLCHLISNIATYLISDINNRGTTKNSDL